MRRLTNFDREVNGVRLSRRSRGLNLASMAYEVFDALEVKDRAAALGLVAPAETALQRRYFVDVMFLSFPREPYPFRV